MVREDKACLKCTSQTHSTDKYYANYTNPSDQKVGNGHCTKQHNTSLHDMLVQGDSSCSVQATDMAHDHELCLIENHNIEVNNSRQEATDISHWSQ